MQLPAQQHHGALARPAPALVRARRAHPAAMLCISNRVTTASIKPAANQWLARITPAAPRQQRLDQPSLLTRAAKDGLDAELEATQKTLDKVLAAVQAAQQQQQPGASPVAGVAQQSVLFEREQQLWDRQQALMDAMQQQWAQERQMLLAREQQLVAELQQLHALLLTQAAAAAAAAAPLSNSTAAAAVQQPAAAARSSVASSPAQAAAAAAAPAGTGASAAASRPAASLSPAQATISGPSSASAAVAAAIRAVRDEGVTPTAASPAGSADATAAGSDWEDLFSSSGERAVSSVASAISAVDTGSDVLADLNLAYSSSRGRWQQAASSNGSSGMAADSTTDSDDDAASSSSTTSALTTSTSISSSSSGGPVEVQKGDPEGPPPVLAAGDDDIFWVSKLHSGLMAAGFYPHDEEVENWMFAESTLTALLTFQACNSLPETGVTCEATWRQLLGSEAYEESYGHLTAGSSGSNGSNGSSASTTDAAAAAATETLAANGEVTYSFTSSSGSSDTTSSSEVSSAVSSSGWSIGGAGWPVVMDMDGGREVHALQICLSKAGYNCGDDEMRWWQFGSSTMDALKTFQACAGLPESGVCDERTWLALLGPEAVPQDLDEIRGDESMYEDDMSAPHEGAVWLVGEQRWSKPPPPGGN